MILQARLKAGWITEDRPARPATDEEPAEEGRGARVMRAIAAGDPDARDRTAERTLHRDA